jgi:hypothetical protein
LATPGDREALDPLDPLDVAAADVGHASVVVVVVVDQGANDHGVSAGWAACGGRTVKTAPPSWHRQRRGDDGDREAAGRA